MADYPIVDVYQIGAADAERAVRVRLQIIHLLLQFHGIDPVVVSVKNCGVFRVHTRNQNMGLNAPINCVLIHGLRDQRDFFGITRGVISADIRRAVG